MAVAGTLELQLVADVARLRADMNRMQGIVGQSAKGMQMALAGVRATLLGMFSGITVAGFTHWITSAIDFQDRLNDLSKSTKLTVETLGGLAVFAQQTGADLDVLAKGINKLSLEMGKAPEKFAKLGITAKDPLEAFKQLSDVFVSIEDPQLRAAVAAEALGRGWEQMAPALSEGSKAIEEAVENGQRLNGATTEGAKRADEFNDAMAEMQAAARGVAVLIGNDLLPVLTEMLRGVGDTDNSVRGANGTVSMFTETIRTLIIWGGKAGSLFTTLGMGIGAFAAQVAAVLNGDFGQVKGIAQAYTEDVKRRMAELRAWEARIEGAGRTPSSPGAGTAGTGRPAPARPRLSTATLRDFVGTDGAAAKAKKLADEAKRAREEYERLVARISGKDSGVDADFLDNLNLLRQQGSKAGLPLAEIIKLQEAYIAQQPYMVKAMQEQGDLAEEIGRQEAAAWEKSHEWITEQVVATEAAHQAAKAMLEQIQFEIDAMAMSNAERERAIALRELERQGIDKASGAYAEYASRLGAKIDEREATRARTEFSQDLRGDLRSALQRAFEDSKNPAKAFIEGFASTMYERVAGRLSDAIADSLFGKGGSSGAGGLLSGLAGLFGFSGGSVNPNVSGSDLSLFYTMHSGGIVGSRMGPMRRAHPGAFIGAPRFHGGGIVGEEMPIIAKRGEGVFTPQQMRAMGAGRPVHAEFHYHVSDTADKPYVREQLNASRRQMVHDLQRRKKYSGEDD